MTVDAPMAGGEHRVRVLALLASYAPDVKRLCAAFVAGQPGITGAGLAVMTTLPARGTRYVSDPVSARIEEMQFDLGEGPCIDAFEDGRPVLAGDLAARESELRWPVFTPRAVAAGARALFAFPLRIGAIRVGVLDLYRDRPGDIDDDELAEALVLADSATLLLLAEGQGTEPAWQLDAAHDARATVHQATGMVMVQIGGTIAEAFARLRAYAYAQARTLDEVAGDVVLRRLRFDELGDEHGDIG